MTLLDTIAFLERQIAVGQRELRRYQVELEQYGRVQQGLPYLESHLNHTDERAQARQAWATSTQKKGVLK